MRNVRRFHRDAIVAQWDALIGEAVATHRAAGALRVPDPTPAPFE
jgi:hypothetical protein